jgi:hypothetical protein
VAVAVRTALVLVIGPVLGLLGLALCAASADFAAHARTTEGVVIGISRMTVSDRYASAAKYRLKVEFVTADGTRVFFEDPEGTSSKHKALVGAKVTVYYDPTQPSRARLNRAGNLGIGIVLAASGILASAVVLVIRRRQRTPALPTSSPL